MVGVRNEPSNDALKAFAHYSTNPHDIITYKECEWLDLNTNIEHSFKSFTSNQFSWIGGHIGKAQFNFHFYNPTRNLQMRCDRLNVPFVYGDLSVIQFIDVKKFYTTLAYKVFKCSFSFLDILKQLKISHVKYRIKLLSLNLKKRSHLCSVASTMADRLRQ